MTTLTLDTLLPPARRRRPAQPPRPPRTLAIAGVSLLGLHLLVAAAVVAALVVSAVPAVAVLAVVAVTYLWGLQHGFAADHIAAVDDATRLLVARRHPTAPLSGLGFGVGHGIAAVVAVVALGLGVRGLPPAAQTAAGVLVAVTLLLLCAWNVRILALVSTGRPTGPRSLLSAVGGQRLMGRVGHAGHLVPVGIVFGVVSAAEVVVMAQSASSAAASTTGAVAVLVAGVLAFSAGLVVVDTADSMVLARSYGWAQGDGDRARRRRVADVATTTLTVVVSGTVGLLQVSDLLVTEAGRSDPLLVAAAGLTARYDVLGASVVAASVLVWLVAWLVTRRTGRGAAPA